MFLILSAFIVLSCNSEKTGRLFSVRSGEDIGIDFRNDIISNDSVNALSFEYIYNGSGVGIGDFNSDGLEDVFFGGNDVSSELYLNRGNLTNPLQFAATVQSVGQDRLTWICGVAESWAPFFWPGGATGFTSGLVNLTADFSLGMLAALDAGDYAQTMSLWNTVRPFEELRARHNNGNNVSVVKEAMAQMDLCQATVRPPITEVSQILVQLGLSQAVAA